MRGVTTRRANRELIERVVDENVDVLILWRGVHITKEVLRTIRHVSPKCLLVSYNNDDPFSPAYNDAHASIYFRRLWTTFRKSIPEYDLNLVYRPVNVEEYVAIGGRDVHVVMPYFVPRLHRPERSKVEDQKRYACDAVFIGHFESDGREMYLQALANAGLSVRVFGTGWPLKTLKKCFDNPVPAIPVYGYEYCKALSSAKLCLCFLSRLNRDKYTRRNFEIPACRGVLLSERTPELTRLFAEDREAIFFDTESELVEKAQFYTQHEARRRAVANAGLKRVWKDGHDVVSRMKEVAELLTRQRVCERN